MPAMSKLGRCSAAPLLAAWAWMAVSAPSVVKAQELSFTGKLSNSQKSCLKKLLDIAWTQQFHKEMMRIGQVATAVLNNRGMPNYVYLFEADGWCGTAGCPVLIGEPEHDATCRLLYDGMGDKSFTVLPRRDHGYRRIYAPCEARFDGHEYQQVHEECPNPRTPR